MIFRKKLKVKPVSVNEAWQLKGFRKFKSKKYREYQEEFDRQLADISWPFKPDVELDVIVRVGFSNRLSDLDNALKPLFDTLSTKYDWNDNKIYSIKARKILVPKGKEFINVSIYTR